MKTLLSKLNLAAYGGRILRLVRLLLAPTWKLRIRQQSQYAQKRYDEAVAAYHEAEAECRNSFYEHNQASYWKGRRDALRVFLLNAGGMARELAAQNSESPTKQNG